LLLIIHPAAMIPGIMDLLNMDVATLPTVRTFPPTEPGQINSPREYQENRKSSFVSFLFNMLAKKAMDMYGDFIIVV
jgi:hypothetical protein